MYKISYNKSKRWRLKGLLNKKPKKPSRLSGNSIRALSKLRG